ncbi:uncharacterized protein LOC133806699 [Humulus lupulus]|uniref:uncharacterized protein LOC133806699 n=1 Tax=Humulus lupulus TaxID=3486 RepID=UPI002B402EE2|nr:uncharacterized protein LOC133806699 [Humulus lupulus]
MEEDQAVWDDIDLSCLPDYDFSIATPFPATTLQDFHSITISSHFNINSSPTTIDSLSFSHAISLCPFVETGAHPPVLSNPAQQSGSSSSTSLVQKKKKVTEPKPQSDEQRMKKLIKSRLASARDRARKEAYKKDLELQQYRLKEEKKLLEKQIQSTVLECPKMSTSLYRTFTAPF